MATKRKRRRSRRGLGDSPAIHTKKMAEASTMIGYSIAEMTNRVRHGKCGAASAVYAEMMMGYGEYTAHQKAGGTSTAPLHEKLVHKAINEFNEKCLVNRDYRSGLARRRRRRKARR